jgi:WD40 repeat protein
MSPSRGERVAVVYFADEGIDVLDTEDGEVVASVPASADVNSAGLSPDGERLAVAEDDAPLRVVDVATGESVDADVTDVGAVLWSDDGRMVALAGGELVLLDGEGDIVRHVELDGSVHAFSPTTSGEWIVAATSDTLHLVDASTGRVIDDLALSEVDDVQPRPGGSGVLVTLDEQVISVYVDGRGRRLRRESGEIDTVFGNYLRSIGMTNAFPVPVAGNDGQLGFLNEDALAVTGHFAAHEGPVTGVVGLDDGRWASVGADAVLRLWDVGDRGERYAGGEADIPELVALYGESAGEESYRNMVQASDDGGSVTITRPGGFSAFVLDRQDLHVEHESPIGMLDSPVRPSTRAGVGLRVNRASGDAYLWSVVDVASIDLPRSPFGGFGINTALSADQRVIGIASDRGIATYDRASPGDGWHTIPPPGDGDPVSLFVDDDGVAIALTTAGELTTSTGDRRQLVPGTDRVAAATTDASARVVLVTQDGRLFGGTRREVDELAALDGDLDAIAVRLSPDGSRAAVVGRDRTLVIDLPTGDAIFEFPSTGGYDAVTDVAFDDDGESAVVIRRSGAVSRWQLPAIDQIAQDLRRWLPRPLTTVERTMFDMDGRR